MILCHLVRVDLTGRISTAVSPHIGESLFKVKCIANLKLFQLKKGIFY